MKKIFIFVSMLALLILLGGCGTALNSAARKADIGAVKELLNKGADPCEQWRGYDDYGLNYTKYYTDEIYRVLINAAYEKINRGGSCSTNILYYAAYGGYNHIVEELLAKGYNVDAGWGNETPLWAAAMGGQKHKETVKILLKNGADLDLAIEGLKAHAADNAQYLDHAANREAYNNANKGLALLNQFKPKQMVQQTNISQNITKEDLANIVKSAVEDAKKSQEILPAIKSDVDELPMMQAKPNKNAYAIVIGVEKYRQKLPKADYADNDARIMAEYLTKVMGYPEENIVMLINDRALKSDLEKYLGKWLHNNVEKDSSVFIYYSGHGAPNPKTGDAFLVPYDGDPSFIEETGYPLKRLYAKLDKLPAREIIVVLDSCFSGAGGRSVLAKGARPLVMNMDKQVFRSDRMAILSAASGSQISSTHEEKGHGLFTYFFLKGIKGGNSELVTLYDYLKPQVERIARKTYNNEQTPGLIAPKGLLNLRLYDR